MKQILDPQLMVAFTPALYNPTLFPSLPLPLPSLPTSFLPYLFPFPRHSSSLKGILHMQFYFLFHLLMELWMYSIKILTQKAYGRIGKVCKLHKLGKTMSKCGMRGLAISLHMQSTAQNCSQFFVSLLYFFFLFFLPFHFSQLHCFFQRHVIYLCLNGVKVINKGSSKSWVVCMYYIENLCSVCQG